MTASRAVGHVRLPREVRATCRAVVVALLAIVLLPSCTTGLVYNRIDWVVSWYVNGLVSLNEGQEAELHRMVHQTMEWHRQSQLPAYVTFLERLSAESARPSSAATMEARYQQVSRYMDDLVRQVMPEAASLLRTLSAEQRLELRENLEEANQELWDDYGGATPEERAQRRYKNALRTLQRFVGRLNEEQRRGVSAQLATMHDVSGLWIERRRAWQARFLKLIESPPPGQAFVSALENLAINPNQFDDADYRRKVEDNRRIIMQMLSGLSGDLDQRQRARLQERFLDLAEDLQRIAEGGGAQERTRTSTDRSTGT
jgi:hypothetical protein